MFKLSVHPRICLCILLTLAACESPRDRALHDLQRDLDIEYAQDKTMLEHQSEYREQLAQLKALEAKAIANRGLSMEALKARLHSAAPEGVSRVVEEDALLGISGRPDRAQAVVALQTMAALAPGLGIHELAFEPEGWTLLLVSPAKPKPPTPDAVDRPLAPEGTLARWTGEQTLRDAVAKRREQVAQMRAALGELTGIGELKTRLQRELEMKQRLQAFDIGVATLAPLLREPTVIAFTARLHSDTLSITGLRLAPGASTDAVVKALGPNVRVTQPPHATANGSYAMECERRTAQR